MIKSGISKLTEKFKKERRRLSLLPFLIPAIVLALIFCYMPMIGLLMGFKTKLNLFIYEPLEAFFNAEWTLENYRVLFSDANFLSALGNTLLISVLKIVILFPIPILFAIFLTDMGNLRMRKIFQAVVYLPHFLSWAIVAALFKKVFSSYGIVNSFLIQLGLMDAANPTLWFQDTSKFLFLVLFTEGWKEIGWSMIVYVSAILAIDQDMLEAARIDGAGKLAQMWYITLPAISTTITTMFILRISYLLDAGFDQIYALHTVTTSNRWQILGTYIFKLGIQEGDYAFSTAVSFFNSVVALLLVLAGNLITKRISGKGIY